MVNEKGVFCKEASKTLQLSKVIIFPMDYLSGKMVGISVVSTLTEHCPNTECATNSDDSEQMKTDVHQIKSTKSK